MFKPPIGAPTYCTLPATKAILDVASPRVSAKLMPLRPQEPEFVREDTPYQYQLRDSVGNVIHVGEYVAYNRSGDVHIGKVERITAMKKPSMWARHSPCDVTIINVNDGKASRVKNPLGIRLILF